MARPDQRTTLSHRRSWSTTLRRNAALLMIAQGLNLCIQLVWAKRIASAIGVEGLGLYSYGLALTQTLGIISDFGLNIFLVREVARDRSQAPAMLSNALAFKLASNVVVWLIFAAVLATLHTAPAAVAAYSLFMAASTMQAIAAIYICLFRALESMQFEAVASVAMNVLNLALCFGAVGLQLPLPWFAAAYAASSLGQLIIMAACYHAKRPVVGLRFERQFITLWFRSVFWIGLGGIFFFAYDRGPQLLLSALGTTAQVGEYAAGYRLIMAALMLPAIVSSVLLPRFAVLLAETNYRRLIHLLTWTVPALTLLGLAIALLLSLWAGRLIIYFYGDGFAAAVVAMRFFAWLPLVVFPGGVLTTLLVALGGDRRYALYSGLEMAIGLLGCLFLVKRFGSAGAALAVLAAAAIVNIAIAYDVAGLIRRRMTHDPIR